MNGDPYRTPQPADRRVINRSGQAYQRAAEEQPQPVKEEPKTTPRSSGPSHRSTPPKEKKSSKGLVWGIIITVLVLALALTGWLLWSNSKNSDLGIDTSRYQAVFLVNGQIYFGKLEDMNDKSFKMTDIYYPQPQSTTEETETQSATSAGIQLIRLGDEVHGPENEMFISKDQILYYENLKSDSKVADLIERNEASN